MDLLMATKVAVYNLFNSSETQNMKWAKKQQMGDKLPEKTSLLMMCWDHADIQYNTHRACHCMWRPEDFVYMMSGLNGIRDTFCSDN